MGKQNNALMLFVMYGAAFLAGFNENLMNMGLMSVMAEYGIDSVTAQWLVTGYMIVSTVGVTAMAFLYRRFKLRSLFFAAAALGILGSGLGLFAGNFAVLMVARVLQGAGMGLFIPMMMNTILCVAPKNKLGSYMAIGGCMISFGPAFAPVVCGALVTALGWHSMFAVPFLGMVALTVMGAIYVRNLENSEAHLDVLSLTLSALFLFALSYGLAQVASVPLEGTIALIVAAASGLVFVLRQRSVAHPLIDMSPMRRIAFWPATLLVFIAMLTTFSLSVLLPLYFEGALGMSALFAGLIILLPVVLNSVMTLVAGRVMDKRGEWPLLPLGFLLMALGTLLMALVATRMSVVAMFVAALLAFAGVGLVFSTSQTAGLRTLPPQMNPFGVALMTTFTQIAACVGPSMFIGIMSKGQNGALAGGESMEFAVAQGFGAAILVATVIAFIGAVTAFFFARAAVKRDAAASVQYDAVAEPLAAIGLADIMDVHPLVLPATAPVHRAMRAMVENATNGMPLVDEKGKLAGYVSDGDIMRYLAEKHPTFTTSYSFIQAANNQTLDERMKELMDLPVGSICTQRVIVLSADATFEEACNLLSGHKIDKVPVLDADGVIVGTLNREEVLRQTMRVYLDTKALR